MSWKSLAFNTSATNQAPVIAAPSKPAKTGPKLAPLARQGKIIAHLEQSNRTIPQSGQELATTLGIEWDHEIEQMINSHRHVEKHQLADGTLGYTYRSQYRASNLTELLRLINHNQDGIQLSGVKDTYPAARDDVMSLVQQGAIRAVQETQNKSEYTLFPRGVPLLCNLSGDFEFTGPDRYELQSTAMPNIEVRRGDALVISASGVPGDIENEHVLRVDMAAGLVGVKPKACPASASSVVNKALKATSREAFELNEDYTIPLAEPCPEVQGEAEEHLLVRKFGFTNDLRERWRETVANFTRDQLNEAFVDASLQTTAGIKQREEDNKKRDREMRASASSNKRGKKRKQKDVKITTNTHLDEDSKAAKAIRAAQKQ